MHLVTSNNVIQMSVRDGPLFSSGGGGGGGGYRDFQEVGNFFLPSIEHLQIFFLNSLCRHFFKFPKFPISGVASADNFFQMHLWGRQFILTIFLMQTIFPQSRTPPPGGNNGPSLTKACFFVRCPISATKCLQPFYTFDY